MHHFLHLYWEGGHGARALGPELSLEAPSRRVPKLRGASAWHPDQPTGRKKGNGGREQ